MRNRSVVFCLSVIVPCVVFATYMIYTYAYELPLWERRTNDYYESYYGEYLYREITGKVISIDSSENFRVCSILFNNGLDTLSLRLCINGDDRKAHLWGSLLDNLQVGDSLRKKYSEHSVEVKLSLAWYRVKPESCAPVFVD